MFEEINLSRRRFLGTAVMTLKGAQFDGITFAKTRSGSGGELSALASATTWLNSQPLTASDLQGKVVLVDFWTYSCINWRRHFLMCARGRRNIKRSWS
jgi:hypothetical protein